MDFNKSIKEAYESKKYAVVINLIENHLKVTKEKLSEENLQYYLNSLYHFGIYDRALKYLRTKTPKSYKSTIDNYRNKKVITEVLSKDELSESILFDYYIVLIKTGEFEKAYEIINSIKNIYPQYIDDFLLVIMLIRCNKIMEAKKIIDNTKFNGNQLLKIGVTFYTVGQYKLSKKTLEEARMEKFSKHYKELYEKLYNNIEEHNKTGNYLSMNYEYFKQNHDLSEGDIIYVSDVDDNYKSIDSYALKRTYMIWKIEQDKIYAFPVTNKIPKDVRCYKLFRQNYLNFDSDRTVKSNLVIINKKYVQKVQERLTREDYLNVLSNIYSGLIVLGDKEKQEQMKKFIDEMYNSLIIEKNNIIVAFNREEKRAKNYLVVDIDEDILYCIEVRVNENYAIPRNYDIKMISKKDQLLRVNSSIKMSDTKKGETQRILEKKPKIKKNNM